MPVRGLYLARVVRPGTFANVLGNATSHRLGLRADRRYKSAERPTQTVNLIKQIKDHRHAIVIDAEILPRGRRISCALARSISENLQPTAFRCGISQPASIQASSISASRRARQNSRASIIHTSIPCRGLCVLRRLPV